MRRKLPDYRRSIPGKLILVMFPFFWLSFTKAIGQSKIENLVVITTDGLRWQEVFNGMDSAIANNSRYNQNDSAYIFNSYWATTASERRRKLMPFLWSTIMNEGRLYGNRIDGNLLNVANPYFFSYPGYNEIFTGYPDTLINSNSYPNNPYTNVLEYINRQKKFAGKVAAFAAWDAFDRILNKPRCGFPVTASFDTLSGKLSGKQLLLNKMLLNSYKPWRGDECLDMFTHYNAMEYLQINKPSVLYISYGETDEWAHSGRYRDYLEATRQVDKWLGELWTYLQHDPKYKNKTALLITTDHGRGDKKKNEWTSHGKAVEGSDEIWLALLAPGIAAKGEMKENVQLYQKQFAQTIAALLGLKFTAEHPVAEAVPLP